MKKYLILISAALALGLAGCGQPAEENTPSAAPAPKPTVMATATAAPAVTASAAPVVSTPEPTPVEATVVPTPMPVVTPTPTQEPLQTPIPAPIQSSEPTPEPPETEEPDPPEEPMVEPARPTDEEVLAAYRAAREAYNWFELKTLDAHQDEKVELDGILYARVADERFSNMDSFRSYLKSLFSDEVVDGLLPIGGQQYVEIEGQLYVSEGARGTDITKGALTLSVVWPQEGEPATCTVWAEVELLDEETLTTVIGTEVHEFPYQRVGDKWVFTQFEAIK